MKIVTSGVDDLPQDLAGDQDLQPGQGRVPDRGRDGDVVVEADDVRTGATAAGDRRARRRRSTDSELFLPGTEVTYSDDGTVAEIDDPDASATAPTPRRPTRSNEIRDEIIPATVGGVDGATRQRQRRRGARRRTSATSSNSRLPLIFAFVFGLAFLLLLVTFRSIVIPIKAILLNLLSVGAAYGVLVLVFQDGHGESLLGFTSNGGVTTWLPLFLFVILFGLSMDYHVFILSRVREVHDRGMSTDEAVRTGSRRPPAR